MTQPSKMLIESANCSIYKRLLDGAGRRPETWTDILVVKLIQLFIWIERLRYVALAIPVTHLDDSSHEPC